MNLIVGATGTLGSEICRLLTSQGESVRGLVRVTSNSEKVAGLKGYGVDVVVGDLKDRRSLDAACRGAKTVASTASSTLSRQDGDSIESVDLQGQLNLIDAAEAAGVRHFVLISFPNIDVEFPLQNAKRSVEDRLRRSGMTHTILQPTNFAEVWLSPALGFDPANARATVYGDGHNRLSWISVQDVARFAVAALDERRAPNATIELGGPDDLSPLEAVRLAEQITGKSIEVQHVPEEALRAQHAAAADSMQKSFAGLMLYYARGGVIDTANAIRILPVGPLRSVREYFQGMIAAR